MTAVAPMAPPPGPVLRDIHLPPDPPWWPPAPGWWCLAAVLLILFVIGMAAWRRQRRRALRRRRLLVAVDGLLQRYPVGSDQAPLAAELHQLLRRAARQLDDGAGRLRGDAWRAVLARVSVDDATLDALMTLDTAMYRPGVAFERERVAEGTRRWLAAMARLEPHRNGRRRFWRVRGREVARDAA